MERGRVILTAALAVLVLGACRTRREVVTLPQSVVTKVERVTELRWDTVTVVVPEQSAQVVTRDSVSRLETEFAESEARICADGSLYHDLRNKAQERREKVAVTVERVDSIVEKEVPVPVYVEKELGRWETWKLRSWWWIVGAVGVMGCWMGRKRIWKVVRKII